MTSRIISPSPKLLALYPPSLQFAIRHKLQVTNQVNQLTEPGLPFSAVGLKSKCMFLDMKILSFLQMKKIMTCPPASASRPTKGLL